MKPVIALVGRPNVGKSTLFNRMTKSRDAIVADFAGLTRDRHYGDGRLGDREFIVVDTGGFEPDSSTGIVREMAKQTRQAVAEADVVIFVVDARAGLSAQDHDIARYLRTTSKRVLLAVNKAEGMRDAPQIAEFHELGMGEPIPVSAAHGQGVRSLLEVALEPFVFEEDEEDEEQREARAQVIRLAVAGRPNVGKSTLINTWLGEERLVAFDMPGTTRDAISVPFERGGRRFELIDTAGLRRKGRVFEAIEKFSVVKTLQAIAESNVVVLLLDATQGVTDQDAHIAGYILDSGRAVVVAVNKWDAVDDYQRMMLQRSIDQRLAFLKFAPIVHISALKRQGLGPLWKAIEEAHASAFKKMPTPVLTRLLHEAVQFQAPKRAGMFRPKLRYAHQGGMNPPVIVIHGNSLEHVTDAYKRFLEGRFREHFKLVGTPLRIEMRSSRNPYSDKDS
ncbi:ribosome biogenesis GTPase Der [Caldimonas thermodepolymerans]|mgnify:CR=1 FL=1|jgi:ribosome-associated GTPase EngA|uniref:GTPase Der n=1 Tax=Caldimonas thermodepolymerans TaxID=215580 RepID=A0A2S5T0C6_9BURK|nr:ribosome biogenesis GTPase Der [Caldimonas thermodepolymerans]PPE68392.1 ribosome biogenesis GTPase Der [Caldimonas thermodepolymerans]QPC30129.1 ribosome biogenesis GTPase Der [Caldimonas thermodepolymerans]RDI00507.1 GTP-binding protein [Caldimonas thermodepolymerans]TCP07214.1 GTP-binding protein [Caldimonas thermodepolymerans]UZG46548.1 ribosome biogenesis GTPase Der [Caldimonas thermodepolymerans]